MKTITNLTATVIDTNFQEPPVYHHNCGDTHAVPLKNAPDRKGIYTRFLRTGPAGVILSNGKVSVVIPKDELWKIAEKAEPLLAVPAALSVPEEVLRP